MRRVIQRVIENNVAKAMLAGMVAPGTTIKITGAQVQSSMGSEPASTVYS